MKYIGYWEYDLHDHLEMLEMYQSMAKMMKEEPDQWPKIIFPYHTLGGCGQGFGIFEADEPNQLARITTWSQPTVKWKFVPIFLGGDNLELMEAFGKNKPLIYPFPDEK